MKYEIKHRYTGVVLYSCKADSLKQAISKAIKSGCNLRDSNLSGGNLRWCDFRWCDFSGCDFSGSDLRGCDLKGSDLEGCDFSGCKNYVNSHDIFAELVRREREETITESEWSFVGEVMVHKFCWGVILKRFATPAMSLFKKLANAGFSEYYNHFETMVKEDYRRKETGLISLSQFSPTHIKDVEAQDEQ